jgi:hypothetical protein
MRYQIRDATSGLAFYEADSPPAALEAYLNDMLRGMALALGENDDPALHGANGSPPSLDLGGARYTAVPA